MSDCEQTDLLCGSWTSLGKRKRKKNYKHDENGPQCKKMKTMTTGENIQEKKKNSKFKEAMAERKEKKKEKKKSKNKLALELDDSFLLPNPCSNEELKPDGPTQDAKKRNKRKRTVAFDLSPLYIRPKRPKLASACPLHPRELTLPENEAVRDSESCSQVTVGHAHDNDSQSPSEDINSQDLFITQKTFIASPSQPSSGEASSDVVIAATPQALTQRDGHLHPPVAQIKEHPEDSHVHQRHRKKDMKKHKPVKVLITEEEEEEERLKKLPEPDQSPRPHLAHPLVMWMDVTKPKKHSRMTSTSTQTENFFTTELSSYLDFCQKTSVAARIEDLKPLDLSLLRRAPSSATTSLPLPGGVQDDGPEDLSMHSSRSSNVINVEVQREASGRTQSKGGASLSPQSESEQRSVDTSEDNEPLCRTSKQDLTQVRAVQMRLNECFFFKTKGERMYPRPASPLMKLAQGREVKSRKRNWHHMEG